MATDVTPVIVFIKNALQGTATYNALQNAYSALKDQYDADEQQLGALLAMIANAPALPGPGSSVPVGAVFAPPNTGSVLPGQQPPATPIDSTVSTSPSVETTPPVTTAPPVSTQGTGTT